MTRKSPALPPLIAVALLPALHAQPQSDRLVVHEWGTFTVLQDKHGNALPGVNINEESLPGFVHRLASELTPDSHELSPIFSIGTHARYASKGIPRSFPAARMRMETPIIYFYPNRSGIHKLDVRVDFLRGWISEWYPDASNTAPGFQNGRLPRGFQPSQMGSIHWRDLRIGTDSPPPKTTSKVWLAPRVNSAATVTTPKGQSERYLFYRGVADLRAPLRVERPEESKQLLLKANARDLPGDQPYTFPALWLVDVLPDGRVAYQTTGPLTATPSAKQPLAKLPASFAPAAYKPNGLRPLRRSMRAELQRAGLFAAEAKAMLDTWEVSYFHAPGLRLFFVMPREWIDGVLPLHLSSKADIARVMIGRIEIITPQQRKLARRIGAPHSVSSPAWFSKALGKLPSKKRYAAEAAVLNGTKTLQDLGIQIPDDYQTYLQIGRFRDAIVLDENRKRSTKALETFVRNYRLRYFQ